MGFDPFFCSGGVITEDRLHVIRVKWLTWKNDDSSYDPGYDLYQGVQNFNTDPYSPCAAIFSTMYTCRSNFCTGVSGPSGDFVEPWTRRTALFWRDYCTSKLKPLCMRGIAEMTDNTRTLPRKKKTKNKKKKKKGRKNQKNRPESSEVQGRQLTDTGRPIEMCATVLPALLGICYFWPSLCSSNEAETSTEPSTDDLEDYEYDDYYDNNDEYYSDDEFF